jgi:hypothetical protein
VSRATLDASVTQLSASKTVFPDPAPGIAQWRDAKGGVFTIPLADILSTIDATLGQPTAAQSPP